MIITGIIVEYNPFHNGHIHHIKQARKLTKCDYLVAIMSGNFVQRGEVSIIDKWERSKIAIQHNIDLVIELPYIYSTQSATQFTKASIDILKLIKVNYIVFGSESNNIDNLKEIAQLPINIDHLKESLNKGNSFVSSYGLLDKEYNSNDILAIGYIKALSNTNITPLTIQRTNNYHSIDIHNKISSATAIRNSIYNNTNISNNTPMNLYYYNSNDKYFNILKHLLLTSNINYLKEIFLVNEGIETHLKKIIKQSNDYQEFINKATTKRYTKSRIQRVITQIINNITKQQVKELPPINYIRPLAFNKKGQQLLKKLKKEVMIANRFKDIPKAYQQMELKTTYTYINQLPYELGKKIINKELQGPTIL